MPFRKIIQFSEPPRDVVLFGSNLPTYSQEEFEAALRESYHRGAEEASRTLERQLMDQRAELVHLQSETFTALQRQHAALFEQFRAMLPELVMEGVARILGGTAPDRQMMMGIVDDLLAEVAPTGEVIEVQLHPGDLELIAGYEENLRDKFPAISFRGSAELQAGDCVVRSRFGVIDGRLSTKFKSVEAMFQ